MTKSKNKRLYIILFTCLFSICAIFMPFIFSKNKNKVFAEQQTIVGGYYTGVLNTPVVYNETWGNNMTVAKYFGVLHWSFDIDPGTVNSFVVELRADGFCYVNSMNYAASSYTVDDMDLFYVRVGSPGTDGLYTYTMSNYNVPVVISADTSDYYYGLANSGRVVYLNFYHTLSSNNDFFNGHVVAVTVTSSWGSQVHGWSNYWSNKYSNRNGNNFGYAITTYTFTDTQGATFNVALPTSDTYGTHTFYNVESIGDSAQYQIGFDNGYQNGKSLGYGQGYSAGQDNGYTTGYNAGLIDGASSDYTFVGLIGATIDAPIKALTGLLNFEILGVNLSAFVYGLFSITLVIIVIKYIKGGK